MPDFDDFEAEERALDFVAGHPSAHAALAFLMEWPAHEHADRLVRSRIREIDGDLYELLDPAASALEGKHPLAAVLLRRALMLKMSCSQFDPKLSWARAAGVVEYPTGIARISPAWRPLT